MMHINVNILKSELVISGKASEVKDGSLGHISNLWALKFSVLSFQATVFTLMNSEPTAHQKILWYSVNSSFTDFATYW